MLFDSHTHINNEDFDDESRAQLISEIEDSAVAYAVDIGFDIASSQLAVQHAQTYDWCYAAVGVHPHDAEDMTDDDLMTLKELLKQPKVVALGEIGLDYFRDISPRDIQQKRFVQQLNVAYEAGVPVTIHDRDSHGDMMEILKSSGAFSEARIKTFASRPGEFSKDAGILLHCYSGSAEQARQYIKLGATLSIAGPVTYKNNHKTAAVVREIPLEYLLIETDAPYLTPEPYRGKPNKSPYAEYTARKIAEIKGISYEEVAAQTLANAKRYFRID
ncbi:MAG: TatD family hydrolase [Clostridiales Family XIII bacterium]|nr:TatD family hydrolase [Clostridiales Family XIII bacterium]